MRIYLRFAKGTFAASDFFRRLVLSLLRKKAWTIIYNGKIWPLNLLNLRNSAQKCLLFYDVIENGYRSLSGEVGYFVRSPTELNSLPYFSTEKFFSLVFSVIDNFSFRTFKPFLRLNTTVFEKTAMKIFLLREFVLDHFNGPEKVKISISIYPTTYFS